MKFSAEKWQSLHTGKEQTLSWSLMLSSETLQLGQALAQKKQLQVRYQSKNQEMHGEFLRQELRTKHKM